MKLLTCNTHSLVENEYEKKLNYFVKWVNNEDYDLIALQEVNQTIECEEVIVKNRYYKEAKNGVKIKKDNHIYNVIKKLEESGKKYYWSWIPIKIGYGKYDEGIGIISKYEPLEIKEFYISESDDYSDWKVRRVIGIKSLVKNSYKWFFSVHLGWWADGSFKYQFDKLKEKLKEICKKDEEIYLMGDFNNPADIRGEGYDEIINAGWFDTYSLAEKKDDGVTVSGLIDGWKEYKDIKEMRIDFIFSNKNIDVKSSKVVFNGKNGEVVSDHFFVEIIV